MQSVTPKIPQLYTAATRSVLHPETFRQSIVPISLQYRMLPKSVPRQPWELIHHGTYHGRLPFVGFPATLQRYPIESSSVFRSLSISRRLLLWYLSVAELWPSQMDGQLRRNIFLFIWKTKKTNWIGSKMVIWVRTSSLQRLLNCYICSLACFAYLQLHLQQNLLHYSSIGSFPWPPTPNPPWPWKRTSESPIVDVPVRSACDSYFRDFFVRSLFDRGFFLFLLDCLCERYCCYGCKKWLFVVFSPGIMLPYFFILAFLKIS